MGLQRFLLFIKIIEIEPTICTLDYSVQSSAATQYSEFTHIGWILVASGGTALLSLANAGRAAGRSGGVQQDKEGEGTGEKAAKGTKNLGCWMCSCLIMAVISDIFFIWRVDPFGKKCHGLNDMVAYKHRL